MFGGDVSRRVALSLSAHAQRHPPAVLVVEDDHALSAMLAELLTDEGGYHVDTAYDGSRACTAA